jgi:hypothetical protein
MFEFCPLFCNGFPMAAFCTFMIKFLKGLKQLFPKLTALGKKASGFFFRIVKINVRNYFTI